MQEDDLVDTGCVVKSMGCVAKNMPLMVRTFAYLTLLPQLLNLASVFLPIEFQAHCGTNTNLKFLTLLIFLVWVFQIVLGVSVKRARPLPPWLFQAQRKGLMSTLCYPVRVIGP
ncbi:unnamed protein product [Prorocentrum cordatum]|uniref:Cation-transporting P-type ATPase C-terminal domain-containing protein n=1 Tax=Prorocentrum cordatum TaxID=2364126 RepID=A0ABN9X6F5_9DINO|nr:unnamed protein product [Polarella glacialis]